MPLNGLHPFLPYMVVHDYAENNVCQCPLTGLLHFYRKISYNYCCWNCVSMPFNGLTSFLKHNSANHDSVYKKRQCHLTGLLHFYDGPGSGDGSGVSMPLNGLHPFLRLMNSSVTEVLLSVNAL